MTTTSFVSGFSSDLSVGVASLDPPLVQQTKSEIRTLASEIASLAHQSLSHADFFNGFLPRMVTAMGAEAAAVWQTCKSLERHGKVLPSDTLSADSHHEVAESNVLLIAEHLLPHELLAGTSGRGNVAPEQYDAPSEPHRRILDCVINEGAPILVPPQSVNVETERPTNPLPHALIIVPVRVEDDIEYVLEIVQRASGGPAAQRGYLRFVAQMADLMGDFLRRQALREYGQSASRVQAFEHLLAAVAQSKSAELQLRSLADGLAELLGSFQTLLLRSGRVPRILAASGLDAVDPRSETILAAEAVERQLSRSALRDQICVEFTHTSTNEDHSIHVESLLEALSSSKLVRLRIDNEASLVAILAYAESAVVPTEREMVRVASALAGLLEPYAAEPKWVRAWWPFRIPLRRSQPNKPRALWQVWTMRAALAGLLAIVAIFPVPQQISATAVLSAKSKVQYFAPFDANVSEVAIDDEANVQKGDVLLTLAAPSLEKELEALQSEAVVLEERLHGLKLSLSNANPGERANALTAQRNDLEAQLESNKSQQAVLQSELAKCLIHAQADGQVTTWDVHNRLTNLPVKYGQMLITTINPDEDWELQVSIPEHRVGLVSDTLSESPGEGVPLRFTLASHPGVTLCGNVSDISQQTSRKASGENVLIAKAAIDGKVLPLKKEGAIANVTIDCGRVPLIWLVVRDAYWACMSRLKLIW